MIISDERSGESQYEAKRGERSKATFIITAEYQVFYTHPFKFCELCFAEYGSRWSSEFEELRHICAAHVFAGLVAKMCTASSLVNRVIESSENKAFVDAQFL